MDITKEQFKAYEEIRASGITNMWDTSTVSKLSNLDDEMTSEIRQLMSMVDNSQDILIFIDIIKDVVSKGYDLKKINDAFVFIFHLPPEKIVSLRNGIKDE